MSAAAGRPAGRPSPLAPESLVFWLVIVLTLYGAYVLGTQVVAGLDQQPTATVIALVVWVIYAAVAVWLISRLQLFDRRPPVSIAAAVSWGALVAVGAAVGANVALQELLVRVGGPSVIETWGNALSAPINEETLKVLGVIALVLLPAGGVRSTFDGLFYGMMVGLGFQVAEDFLYAVNAVIASGSIADAWSSMLTRGLVGGIFSHAVYTGITGAGIGYAASRTDQPWVRRIGVAVALFLVAVFFHSLWDSPLLGKTAGEPFLPLIGMFVKGIPLLVFLIVVVRWARRDERRTFERISATTVDPALLSASERADLESARTRRRARKAARKRDGRKAGRATGRLQDAQLELVQAIREDGPDGPAAARAMERIRGARSELSSAGGGPGAPAPAGAG